MRRKRRTYDEPLEDVAELSRLVREAARPLRRPEVGFYGVDVYSLWDSLYAVMNYLRKAAPTGV